MQRRILAISFAGACIAWLGSGATALAAKRCVDKTPGCYPTIQAAVDAAVAGDTIKVGPGTFAGGLVITKSIALTGAGAGATVIRGGGPVVTVGTVGAATQPTVSLARVRITGGRTSASPLWDGWGGGAVAARGGGVSVPPGEDFSPGATVSIDDSVIDRNRAAPAATQDSGNATCPSGPCPFALAEGGGIDNWGTLTVTDTVVAHNEVGGPLASDADGAGIFSIGDLTVVGSLVARNLALGVAPNGRFAEGGGVMAQGGTLTIRNSAVDRNLASLSSTFPPFVDGELLDVQAHAGGIHVGDGIPTLIDGVRITSNAVRAFNPRGEPLAFDAAMLVNDSPLTMRDTVIAGNHVSSVTATTQDTGPAGTAIEVDGGGTIEHTRIVGNTVSVFTADGVSGATGGLAVYNFSDHDPLALTVRDSRIAGDESRASTQTGTAGGQGGGIINNSLLELHPVLVHGNVLEADGPSGALQGGGIWNGAFLTGPPVELTVADSAITGNVLRSHGGVTAAGGGLFTTEPIDLTRTRIAFNQPDQCSGCAAARATWSAAQSTRKPRHRELAHRGR